jgi:hypothetical protein
VLDSEPTLKDRITGRLADAGCDTTALQVVVTYLPRPGAEWNNSEFHVDFTRGAPVPTVPATTPSFVPGSQSPRELTITVVNGTAEQTTYVFALPRVNLGRCSEVRDTLSRLVRTNHVAFVDVANANPSVSRRHAHIEFVEASRDYRIRDDRSAHGTSVVRNGRTVAVPAGSRGIRLQSGDEIVLGEARARVQIG